MLNQRINNSQEDLTKTDYQILNYLMAHKEKVLDMSIHEISEKTFVSAASIVRLAKKLNFSGFSELKFSLRSEIEEDSVHFKSSISLLEDDINDTLNLISEQNLIPICQEFSRAKNIFVYGTDWGEKVGVSYLARNFIACNIYSSQFPSITEFHWALDNISEDDLVVIISFSGSASHLKEVIPSLKIKNVPILSITPLSGNYLASEATYRLYYKGTNLTDRQSSQTEYNFFSSLSILIEFLYRYYNDNFCFKG